MGIEHERLPEYEGLVKAVQREADMNTQKGHILKEYIISGRLHSTWGWYLQLLAMGKVSNDNNLSQKAAPYVLEITSRHVRRKIQEDEILRRKVFTAVCEAIRVAHEPGENRYNYINNIYKYLPEILDDMVLSYIEQGKMVCGQLNMPISVFSHFIEVIIGNDNRNRLENFILSQYKVVASGENSNELIELSIHYATHKSGNEDLFLRAFIIVWLRCHKLNSASTRKTEKILNKVLTECSKRGSNIIDCYIDIVLDNKLCQDYEYGLLKNEIYYQRMTEELVSLQTINCSITGDKLDELLAKGSELNNSETLKNKYERLVYRICSQFDIVMEDRAYLFQKRLLIEAAEELLCKLHEKGLFGRGALDELINAPERDTYLRAMPLLVMWKFDHENNESCRSINT